MIFSSFDDVIDDVIPRDGGLAPLLRPRQLFPSLVV